MLDSRFRRDFWPTGYFDTARIIGLARRAGAKPTAPATARMKMIFAQCRHEPRCLARAGLTI